MCLDLGDGLRFDHWADDDAWFCAIADLEFLDLGRELFSELVVDPALHIDAVGADTGLARIAVFGNHGTVDGGVQISIVEHDERRIAAKFQRDALDGRGALRHQQASDFRRAGEGELAHNIIACQFGTNFTRLAGNDLENASRNACLFGKNAKRQCRQRREVGGAHDHGATGRKGRGCLAGNHRCREVPWRDCSGDADRLADDRQALSRLRGRDSVSIDALCLFGEPFDE